MLVAARHYHHLYDGCLLLAASPRPVRLVVALDWVEDAWRRRGLEALCAWAGWPGLLRSERLSETGGAYRPREALRYLRRSLEAAVGVLLAGEPLVVFPEGYPNVDPRPTPKLGDEMLPFRRGFAVIATVASRRLGVPLPVLPAGLHYQGRCARLAFGAPIRVAGDADVRDLVGRVESEVRRLSAPAMRAPLP